MSSAPALRQPKLSNTARRSTGNFIFSDSQNVILTLKDCKKLVISSDAYHGILMVGNMYKCVFCGTEMELDNKCKEEHKSSDKHIKCIERYPHLEEFSENLLRMLSRNNVYCSICNVVVMMQFLARHIDTDAHREKLEKAEMKANTYKPY